MKQRLQRFMMGRYGADQLNRFLLFVAMAFLIISLFSKLQLFYIVALVILVYTYFRMFSRNINKRYSENQKFLNIKNRIKFKIDKMKRRQEQSKIYHFFRCPGCRQTVRVPRGKGKICITCPKCKMEFVRKS